MNNIFTALYAGVGSALAIVILALLDNAQLQHIWIMAPFGASAVLVFGVPDSPLAQPKNVILGHLLAAFIGLIFLTYFSVTPITLALATGLGVSAMLLSKTTHPPAGANPLLIMLTGQSWSFLLTPVLLGAIVIVLCGMLMTKLKRKFLSQTQ